MPNKEGKIFESNFRESAKRQGIFELRLRDCPGAWHQNINLRPENLYYTKSNEYDLLLFYPPFLIALELKSFATTSFSFNSIRDNQEEGLLKTSEHKKVHCGVILNFRKYNKTFFIEINKLIKTRNFISRKSINLKLAQVLGIEIRSKKLRVNYRYDIITFLKELTSFNLTGVPMNPICSLCHRSAITEIDSTPPIYLCSTHDKWTDDQILRGLQQKEDLPECEECRGIATETQYRKSRYWNLCAECAWDYTIKELQEYG